MVCKLYLNKVVKDSFKKELEENVKQCVCVAGGGVVPGPDTQPELLNKCILNERMGRWRAAGWRAGWR